MITFLVAVAAASALGLGASWLFTWASRKSAVWNIGFAVVLVLSVATVIILILSLLTRRISN